MKGKEEQKIIKLSDEELSNLQNEIERSNLSHQGKSVLINLLKIYLWLSQLYFAKKLSLNKLKRLFSFSSEKQEKKDDDDKKGKGSKNNSGDKKGHGRNGEKDFPGAKKEFHPLTDKKNGDKCPECKRGKLYPVAPGTFIHFTGQCPICGTIHETEKLKCNTCGKVFEAALPEKLGGKKYDETADASIALQRYGLGVPNYRLAKWQKDMGVPLAASTQWARLEELGTSCYPIFEYLKEFAKDGTLYHIDDTGNKILDLQKELRETTSKRKGIFTTGVIVKIKGKVINLFFTGNKHAGENIASLIKESTSEMILMSDALSRNCPKDFIGIWCNCLTHARRGFYDLKNEHNKMVGYVLYLFGKIYYYDELAKKRNYSPGERLILHQKKSTRVIHKLRRWCLKMFYLKKVEPNEELGGAIKYFLTHFEKLTEFLRVPGVPLDNTAAERLLKASILHRKNSLFYKSQLGAYIGDMMMSLIQTARAANVDVFNYLVEVHKHRAAVKSSPELWSPWNYQQNL